MLIASRTPWAMSDDGLLPRFVSRVNAGGTPHLALAASTVATIALVLSGTFQTVLALSAFFYVMQYATSFASLFVWIPALVLFGALAFIVGNFIGDQANSIRAVVVIAASYPLYLLAKRLLRT